MLKVTLTSATFLLLTACVAPNPLPPSLNQICENLKQDIIMGSNQKAPQEVGSNPTVEARLYQEYRKNDCDNVLKQRKISPKAASK